MRSGMQKTLALVILVIASMTSFGATVKKVTSGSTSSSAGLQNKSFKKKGRNKHKIRLDFANVSQTLIKADTTAESTNSDSSPKAEEPVEKRNLKSSKTANLTPKKPSSQFVNEVYLGLSNSAYRYAEEEFETQSFDYAIAPAYRTKCISIDCNFGAKIAGSFALNEGNKHFGSALQLIFGLSPSKWGGLLAPSYTIKGYLPAKQKDFEDQLAFAYAGVFGLATTPELLGTDVVGFSGSVDFKRFEYKGPIIDQANWSSRQALTTNIKFSESIEASLTIGNIWITKYDDTDTQILELSQSLSWSPADWIELSVSHSNIGPMYSPDGSRIEPNLVSIDNSVVSAGASFKSSF